MGKTITVIKGDGIGPEITDEAVKILKEADKKYNIGLNFLYADMGGCAIEKEGTPLPKSTLEACLESDAVLLGAVGGDKWNNIPPEKRPEKGLLELRKKMGVYANIRPSKIWKQLSGISPLKSKITDNGVDFVIIRELTGGIYFGEHKDGSKGGQRYAYDELYYSENEIERIARIAFETARKRRKNLCSVEKSNVLSSSKLWKEIFHEVSSDYPDITLTDMLVDNCAMQIIKNPSQFDVIATENMFGDILSDEASMITGSIGMMPSASIGNSSLGLYEPIHGSAPDIASKDIANPIGAILSASMMLRYSFNMEKESDAIDKAVSMCLDDGYRTRDIMEENKNLRLAGCKEMGNLIRENIFRR